MQRCKAPDLLCGRCQVLNLYLREEAVSEILKLLGSIERNVVRCPETEKQFKRIKEILSSPGDGGNT